MLSEELKASKRSASHDRAFFSRVQYAVVIQCISKTESWFPLDALEGTMTTEQKIIRAKVGLIKLTAS